MKIVWWKQHASDVKHARLSELGFMLHDQGWAWHEKHEWQTPFSVALSNWLIQRPASF